MTAPPCAAAGLTAQDIDALAHSLRQQGETNVAVSETHISWIVLAGQRVWKFKKPVQLPFVDFSTAALRQQFCEEELRLNRRLAADLYHAVRPVWRDDNGVPTLDAGAGAPIDWAVEMQRFADDALLARQIEQHAIDAAAMHDLGVRLAQFHAQQAGAPPPDAGYGSPALIAQEVRALFTPLQGSAFAGRLPAWQAWAEAQCLQLAPVWQQRHAHGCIREGHGDLHAGNLVVLDGRIVPFDCLEFQPAMRWIDVVSDAAFLSMDLHAHGRSDLAAHFMDGWLQRSGDFGGLATWRFYEVYRALVRAMVAQLQVGKNDPAAADAGARYARLLDGWCAAAAPTPRLSITCGLSGSGKSTVAAAVMEATGAIRIRSDVERKRLFGLDALDDSRAQGLDIYTPAAGTQTFARLETLAAGMLASGWSVVVDAAFLRREQREAFRALAERLQVDFAILACEAPTATLQQRIAQRQATARDPSEASVALLAQQAQWQEPFSAEERACMHPIDTTHTDWREQAMQALA